MRFRSPLPLKPFRLAHNKATPTYLSPFLLPKTMHGIVAGKRTVIRVGYIGRRAHVISRFVALGDGVHTLGSDETFSISIIDGNTLGSCRPRRLEVATGEARTSLPGSCLIPYPHYISEGHS